MSLKQPPKAVMQPKDQQAKVLHISPVLHKKALTLSNRFARLPVQFTEPHHFAFFVLDPSGWWTGRLRGKQGLFPNNYVTKI